MLIGAVFIKKQLPEYTMKIVILGAGLSGMAAAKSLAEHKSNEITILEKAPYAGGLASSFHMEGEEIPKFYHHIVRSNKFTIAELERFGLMKDADWKKIKVSIGIKNKVYNIQNPFELLKLPGASLWAKFRFGLFGLYTLFIMNPNNIPDEMNAKDWLYKFCGKEATDFFWWNLYGRNKFNIPLDQIAAKQFAHRLWEKEVYDDFTFPKKGLQLMVDGMEKELVEKGVNIRLKQKIIGINLTNKTVSLETGEKIKYDVLINSIPVPEFLKVQKGLPEDYKANLEKLRYCPAVGMCFATKEFLKPGVYWINLFGERIQVIMQHSVLIDKYKNKVSWLIRYGGAAEDLGKSDEEIRKLYLADIKKYFPTAEIVWDKVFKEKYAEPVYDKDYVKYAPTYTTPVDSLYMTGIQVTFPKIRNQNVALESGYKVAEIIKARLP